MTVSISIPNQEQKLKLEVQSSLKIKRLKEQIYEKIGGYYKADRMKLSIEDGEILDKS